MWSFVLFGLYNCETGFSILFFWKKIYSFGAVSIYEPCWVFGVWEFLLKFIFLGGVTSFFRVLFKVDWYFIYVGCRLFLISVILCNNWVVYVIFLFAAGLRMIFEERGLWRMMNV